MRGLPYNASDADVQVSDRSLVHKSIYQDLYALSFPYTCDRNSLKVMASLKVESMLFLTILVDRLVKLMLNSKQWKKLSMPSSWTKKRSVSSSQAIKLITTMMTSRLSLPLCT